MDVIIAEAHDPPSPHPFKGNVDLDKLETSSSAMAPSEIPYVSIAATVNMAGGQPISLANLRDVRELTQKHGIRSFWTPRAWSRTLTSSRSASRATPDRTIAEIVREFCALHRRLHHERQEGPAGQHRRLPGRERPEIVRARPAICVVVYEGLHTYGGMAGRDMEAVAIGIEESVQDDHIRARVGQVRYLGEKLIDGGVPIVRPIGGHGVFLDARAFLPHIPQEPVPGAGAGRRALPRFRRAPMERGIVSAGRDPETGEDRMPKLELVRLTIPRRVYTQAHMDVTRNRCRGVYEARRR